MRSATPANRLTESLILPLPTRLPQPAHALATTEIKLHRLPERLLTTIETEQNPLQIGPRAKVEFTARFHHFRGLRHLFFRLAFSAAKLMKPLSVTNDRKKQPPSFPPLDASVFQNRPPPRAIPQIAGRLRPHPKRRQPPDHRKITKRTHIRVQADQRKTTYTFDASPISPPSTERSLGSPKSVLRIRT
jgi:hypothetical protein